MGEPDGEWVVRTPLVPGTWTDEAATAADEARLVQAAGRALRRLGP